MCYYGVGSVWVHPCAGGFEGVACSTAPRLQTSVVRVHGRSLSNSRGSLQLWCSFVLLPFFFFFLSFFRIVDLLYRTIASNLFEFITLKTMYRGKKKLEKKIIRFKCILNRILSEWNLPDFGFFVKIRIEDERSENGMINRRFVTWCSLVFRWNLFDRITKGIENANYFPRRSQ